MDRQEIFDRAASALIAQGTPSYGPRSGVVSGGCLYRGPNGLKCAIGHLIPDDRYSPGLEGLSGDELKVVNAAGLDNDEAEFLEELQATHDNPAMDGKTGAEWLREFKGGARELADKYGLSPAVLDAA